MSFYIWYRVGFLRHFKNRDLYLTLAKRTEKTRFTESQILKVLKEQESGKKVSEICREYGISHPTFFNWKSKYEGMTLSELYRLKELEEENARLKRIVAD
jgi:putative transposase